MPSTTGSALKKEFSRLLLSWNRRENRRQMPWKGEKDPYRIWLSEIILQQTRVEQGLEYYNRFTAAFPNVHKLAGAPDAVVFKLWEGLGYYSRCRNLLFTARYISKELKGRFPSTYEEIKALKGVGPYSAAAISSFAYNLPHAVVDGNVYRVLARTFGISVPSDSAEGKKLFSQLAEELLDKKQPGQYNQAIMDFGAVVCKPVSPLCDTCVFRKHCAAFLQGKTAAFPVKEKKTRIRKRWFYYLVAQYKPPGKGTLTAIRHRTEKDIWKDLYEFLLVEREAETPAAAILAQVEKNGWLTKGGYSQTDISPVFKQQLSHQLISGRFIRIKLKKKPPLIEGWQWVEEKRIAKYAFPRFINQYLEEQGIRSL